MNIIVLVCSSCKLIKSMTGCCYFIRTTSPGMNSGSHASVVISLFYPKEPLICRSSKSIFQCHVVLGQNDRAITRWKAFHLIHGWCIFKHVLTVTAPANFVTPHTSETTIRCVWLSCGFWKNSCGKIRRPFGWTVVASGKTFKRIPPVILIPHHSTIFPSL